MAMKVVVNPARCVGHGMCALAAPAIFQLSDEDGHAYVSNPLVLPKLEDAVIQAQRSCPEEAVEIQKD